MVGMYTRMTVQELVELHKNYLVIHKAPSFDKLTDPTKKMLFRAVNEIEAELNHRGIQVDRQ